jgi:hypothetical protein
MARRFLSSFLVLRSSIGGSVAERQGYHIAVMAGDGIGPEVTAASIC